MMGVLHRLYLSKGAKEVYIDNFREPQHFIDGLRFIYKQFKLKKPGVIVNDTSGNSRDVQIVLFIRAVRHLLDKPVLVLCCEGAENNWLRLFQTRTDLNEDVVIETSKPYLKKKVLINPESNLAAFGQREWGIVVIADDTPTPAVVPFKADFKIWSTGVDMKENLTTFSSIYAWLGQENGKSRNKFNMSEFIADKDNVIDVIDKALLLDAFMEDIVLRRKDLDCNIEEFQKELPIPEKMSRKNKDAKGTKIKRSKKKIEDNTPVNSDFCEKPTGPKLFKPSNMENDITGNTIADKTSPDMDLDGETNEININYTHSQDSEMNLIYETDSLAVEGDKMDKHLNTDDAISNHDVDMECKMGEINSNIENEINSDQNSCEPVQSRVKLPCIIIPETEDSSNGSENIVGDSQDKFDKVIEPTGHNNHEVLEYKRIAKENEILSQYNRKPTLVKIIFENEFDSEPGKISYSKSMSEHIEIEETQSIHDDIKSKDEVIDNYNDLTTEDCNTSINDTNEMKNDIENVLKDESIIENVAMKSEASTKKDVNKVLDDIDKKNIECKEQILKRFKGSFLDSIF